MCKISVVAPVYNMEKYIDQFLESIRKQTLDDFEVILIDDGSTDSSPAALDQFAAVFSRCKVIHQENLGVCNARNKGIRHAQGEYLYIVDSDDWLAPNALLHLWRAAEETDADVIYGQAYIEFGNTSELEKPFPAKFCTENRDSLEEIQCSFNNKNLIRTNCPDFEYIDHLGGAPWRAMVRRKLLIDHEVVFDESLTLGEDILFWQNVYDHVKRAAYIEVPIYHYRVVTDSLSHGYKGNLLTTYQQVFEAEESYLRSTEKGRIHWDAYYFRVLIHIHLSMYALFLNPENPSRHAFRDFKQLLKTEPYRTAIQAVPLDKLLSKKTRLPILLLRRKQYRLYWLLRKRA